MVISIESGEVFDKIQPPFFIKSDETKGTRNVPQPHKGYV
jgi:hypothetical protein